MASLVYAPTGSGPSAGSIGWIDFGGINIVPGAASQHVAVTLRDGTLVEFDLSAVHVSGATTTFQALGVPTWNGTFFSNPEKPVNGYALAGLPNDVTKKIPGTPAIISNTTAIGKNTLRLSNITLRDTDGNIIPKYLAIVADAESTDTGEVMEWITDGTMWRQFALLGNTVPPASTGIGTSQTVTLTGAQAGVIHENYVLTTGSPKTLNISTQATTTSARLGFSIAFIATKVELRKVVNGRLNLNDQFDLTVDNINDTDPLTGIKTVTTTGNTNGPQVVKSILYGYPTEVFRVSEAMALGSVNPLTAYNQTVTVLNLSPGQPVPTPGPLPQTVTVGVGDMLVYTVTNAIDPVTAEKKVDKADAGLGEVITYSVDITNPNEGILSGVSFDDAIPLGTTFEAGSLTVTNATFTGTDIESGIVLNDIPANGIATVSWKVKIGDTEPNPNPIPNTATVSDPTGAILTTNEVQTNVNYADLLSPGNFVKSVDKAGVEPGGIITYTLTIKNTGTIAAQSVVITDVLPQGVTYVEDSTIGSVSVTGDPTTSIQLTDPLPAGATETVMFQVKAPDTIPNPNVLENQASISYEYIPNPANPVVVAENGDSNIVETEVNEAKLRVQKTASEKISYVGETIKYNIAVTNDGNVDAQDVVIKDILPAELSYVPGSLTSNVEVGGDPLNGITLTNPVAPGETVIISFEVMVNDIPNPNPINNVVTSEFNFIADPVNQTLVGAAVRSNEAVTFIPRYNFGQQITDIIQSVALEQAALAAIANAEGAKIQAMVKRDDITPKELLCLNKSVADTLESISLLEGILKQKLNALNCQINPGEC